VKGKSLMAKDIPADDLTIDRVVTILSRAIKSPQAAKALGTILERNENEIIEAKKVGGMRAIRKRLIDANALKGDVRVLQKKDRTKQKLLDDLKKLSPANHVLGHLHEFQERARFRNKCILGLEAVVSGTGTLEVRANHDPGVTSDEDTVELSAAALNAADAGDIIRYYSLNYKTGVEFIHAANFAPDISAAVTSGTFTAPEIVGTPVFKNGAVVIGVKFMTGTDNTGDPYADTDQVEVTNKTASDGKHLGFTVVAPKMTYDIIA
jgi:hypothetical protein